MKGTTPTSKPSAAQRGKTVELRARLRVLHEKDEPRLCSDIPCLLLLVAFCVALMALIGAALALRQPDWLRGGWDFHARVCGVDSSQQGRHFVYWPRPEELDLSRCIPRCPDDEDHAQARKMGLPRPEPLLIRESGFGADLNTTVSQSIRWEMVHVYPTIPALGRFCIPEPETILGLPPPGIAESGAPSGAASAPNGGGLPRARESMLPALAAGLGAADAQLRRAIGGLRQVRWSLSFCTFPLPLLVGAGVLFFALRRGALACLWTLIVAFGVGCLGTATSLLLFGGLHASDARLTTLSSLELEAAWLGGLALAVVGTSALLAALALRDRLRWAASCVEAASAVLAEERLLAPLVLLALAAASLQGLATGAWLALLEAAASVAALEWPAELPATNARFAGAPSDDEAEIVPGGPLVRSLARWPSFRCPSSMAILGSAFLLRLVLSFILALGRYLIAHVVASWYFADPAGAQGRRLGRLPVLTACRATASAHLGGAASAAALHTFALPGAVALRALAAASHKVSAPWAATAAAAAAGRRGEARGPALLGAAAAALGTAPFAEVALFAGHFHIGAARGAASLRQALPAMQFLSSLPALVEAAACGFAWLAAFSGLLLLRLSGQQHGDSDYVELRAFSALVAGSLAIAPTCAFLLPISAGFDTLLECMIIDDVHHRVVDGDSLAAPSPARWALDTDASYALWVSRQTPQPMRSLVFEAAHAAQQDAARVAGRSAHSLALSLTGSLSGRFPMRGFGGGSGQAAYGYAPVGSPASDPYSPAFDDDG